MKKIPYGISSFEKIKTGNYYYMRPRRFGKSLFISMLHHYYDIKQGNNFEVLFGDTFIGKNPTPLRNTYPILRFNFSMVKTFGSIEEIQLSFVQNMSPL